MDLLKEVDIINGDIRQIRQEMLQLIRNDSQRCLEMDRTVLHRIEQLKSHYLKLRHEQRRRVHSAYSVGRNANDNLFNEASWFAVEPLLIPKRLRIVQLVIGESLTRVSMAPASFHFQSNKESLKNIKYPSSVVNRRPFQVVAQFRSIRNETNNFNELPIYLEQSSLETLILALDTFVQRFDGNIYFTETKFDYESSLDRLVFGLADFGNIHLLASQFVCSAKFLLLLDINYEDFARHQESIETFVPAMIDALAVDLSLSHEFIRITTFQRSDLVKGKTHLTVVLTTPDKSRTEEFAKQFQVTLFSRH